MAEQTSSMVVLSIVDRRKHWFVQILLCNSAIAAISQSMLLSKMLSFKKLADINENAIAMACTGIVSMH
jgi:hypothetical protein